MKEKKIVSNPEVLNGEPHLEGTRVSAWKIHDMYTTMSMSYGEIAEELPTVSIEGAKAAVEYIESLEEDETPVTA